jgi:RNA recognition motif-containing protein
MTDAEAAAAAEALEAAQAAKRARVAAAQPAENARTVFVAGFPRGGTEADIMGLLGPCGRVLKARLVDKRGNYRGWGYVDFADEAAVAAAVALNGTPFAGKPVKVARSDPAQAEGRSKLARERKPEAEKSKGVAPGFIPRAVGSRRPQRLALADTSETERSSAAADKPRGGLGQDDFRKMFLGSGGGD